MFLDEDAAADGGWIEKSLPDWMLESKDCGKNGREKKKRLIDKNSEPWEEESSDKEKITSKTGKG